jgi:hypothetical protein
MKKIIIAIVLLSATYTKINACSWSSEDGSFYNLFNQQLISDKSLLPFFLTYDETFYSGNGLNDDATATQEIDYNILEWKKYFNNQLNEQELHYFVYQSSVADLSKISISKSLKGINDTLKKQIYLTDKGIEAINYLLFAKKCEPFATSSEESDDENWYYGSIRKKMTKPEFMSTAKDGNLLYAATKDTDIKLRIAYQLVRLSHYGGFNDDAIRYFNTYVVPLKQKTLLYYYALEQKAGALFNQKKFAEAGNAFAEVFHNTTDRKIPCYASFRISNQMSFDKAILLCKTPNEKAALYVLRGFNKFSNGLSEMKNIYAVAPNSAYLELMACRALLQMEHTAFQIPNQYNDKNTFPLMNVAGKTYLQKAILFTQTLLKENKTKRIDFWQTYLAHLYLLNGEYAKAQATTQKIQSTDKDIIAQKDKTEFCAYIGSLKTIDAAAEQKIYQRYLNQKEASNETGFVYEILGHNYILQNNLAKAFLCHNNFSGLYGSLNIAIINDLIDFVGKKNKSDFEQKLISDKIASDNALAELYDLKGTHYFKKDDLENALIWYKKVAENLAFLKQRSYDYDKDAYIETDGIFNGYSNISAGIFSSKVQTYFDNTVEQAFSDNTYTSFDFIRKSLNKQQLVEAMIQLKKMAAGKDEQAAKANFLLGNFYYNTSHWGYYRNFFYYEPGNYYLSYLYGYNTTPNTIKKTYNYNEGAGLITSNNPQKAYDFFIKAESISSNNELKAKSVFQASKCELDLFFSKGDNAYFGYGDDYKLLYSTSTRPMFKRLKDNYSQTAYYKEIQSNCNYFKYYLQFRL